MPVLSLSKWSGRARPTFCFPKPDKPEPNVGSQYVITTSGAMRCAYCTLHNLGARTSPSACGRDARSPGSRDCRSGLVKTRPPSPRRVGSAHHACPELVEVVGQSPTYNCNLRQAQDRLIAPY